MTLNPDALRAFLVRATLHTYAAGTGARTLPDATKELEYLEEGWRYHDRYAGFDPFAGQEIVWHAGRPCWTMLYYGGTCADALPGSGISTQDLYTFLQAALRQVTPEHPYRGPDAFREGDYAYHTVLGGDIDTFTGIETILYRDREVYRLDYRGGTLT